MVEKRINWTRDEIILACELVMRNGWRRLDATDQQVHELSDLLRAAPIHPPELRGEKFRNTNGVGRKTSDIATRHPDYPGTPTNGSHLDREVLAEFLSDPATMSTIAAEIKATILRGDVVSMALDDDGEALTEAIEGRLLFVRHRRRERSPKLRAKKIEATRRSGLPIACEVCGFDFHSFYGELGADFIEVHHVTPLYASGETVTRLCDLALLCSNCHRMIHRARPWVSPSELHDLLPVLDSNLSQMRGHS